MTSTLWGRDVPLPIESGIRNFANPSSFAVKVSTCWTFSKSESYNSVNLYTASPRSITDSLLGDECCLASTYVILTIWNICQHTRTHRAIPLYQCNPPYMKCLSFVGAKLRWAHNNGTQRSRAAGRRLRTGILLFPRAHLCVRVQCI